MWIGIAGTLTFVTTVRAGDPIEPSLQQILEFCGREPVERVFLEDVARRGLGRFAAFADRDRLTALCHVGANVVPSGTGCGRFANAAARGRARMLIGDEQAVTELWDAAAERMPQNSSVRGVLSSLRPLP